MRKVIFLDTVHSCLEEALIEHGFLCIHRYKENIFELSGELQDTFGIILRSRLSIDSAFLNQAPQLKFVARSGSGLENIDLQECNNRGIEVISSPEGNADAVGEHCLGLLLALANKIPQANSSVRHFEWEREMHRGFELKEKTIGIIGYGHMGKAFAKRLSGFGCEVLAHDKYLKNFSDGNAEEATLDELFEKSDVVSIHLPLSQETIGYVNLFFLNQFKKNIVLLNTARGNHIVAKDLILALEMGKITHCGLDVLPFEKKSLESLNPSYEFDQLLQFQNVIFTPHVAGWTNESYIKLSQVLANKILTIYG
jgi:D-3-phosphoglycerate dehydrogenase